MLLSQTSNFISDFQAIMLMTMSCFRTNTFAIYNGQLTLDRSNGFQIQSISANDFQLQDPLISSASPYSSDFLASNYAEDIPNLFTNRHIHFLKSGSYGVCGLQAQTKTRYPLRTLLMDTVSNLVNQFMQPKYTLHMACIDQFHHQFISHME
ncbi:hypothetical protein A0J61_10158 [Choanephora cucurbitarum]|uniref:Uncharacterized protein n=1 Tax=Choanephora cucurbitarum TaxID=101091 RepID=A0A1C7MYB0_9FUNG|nr:hypothetical protein A0J61_10158 [Choanephora cucurbitarum]